jgi:hypothetical protein
VIPDQPEVPEMASLSRKLMDFARSRQGQQLVERVKVEANKPENRRKIEQLRRRINNTGKR